MKEMKKIVLALILVLWAAGAPMALAQEARALAPQGIFASFAQWIQLLVEELLSENPSWPENANPPGAGSEFQAYIIPGG